VPLDREGIERQVARCALGRILKSPRWSDRAATEALWKTILALQDFANWAGDELEAIDINPLILGGGRAIAVDALIIPRQPRTTN